MVKKIIMWVVGIIALVFLVLVLMAYYWNYSDGYRVGQVIKLSHKGYLFKTWEGQLDQGFLAPSEDNGTGSGVATRLWDFSVRENDTTARKQIDSAISMGYKVKVYYKEKIWNVSFWGDTRYFVYKVEKAGN